MLTDHTIAVTALVAAGAAVAGLVCGYWMLVCEIADLHERNARVMDVLRDYGLTLDYRHHIPTEDER